jgi:plasmid maintenance system antidote protein VapI
MLVYEAQTYRHFVSACLGDESSREWGAVKKLAAALKCHSTYVSQILSEKAHLSTEQAVMFCRYFHIDLDASEFFLDLVARDKAGNDDTRRHFQQRLDRRLGERLSLKNRLRIDDALTAEHEGRYYDGWLPQAVHICCQLPGSHSAKSLAQTLKAEVGKVESILKDLEAIGLVEKSPSGLKSLKDSVHLAKDSPNNSRFHTNWRLKTTAELMTTARMPGAHYSSVISISAAAVAELQELILRHLEACRAIIVPAPAEQVYVHCIDFYALARS